MDEREVQAAELTPGATPTRHELVTRRSNELMAWRSNVRILRCTDGSLIPPCPCCSHPFGEHNMVGDCLVCLRVDENCEVNMHDVWPTLIPA